MHVLLLEDDLQLGAALRTSLAKSEFTPVWVRRVQEAKEQLLQRSFAAALLDIGLADGSGLEVLTWLREAGNNVPVIMLTARDSVNDRIHGLESGADDYLPKPFAIPELVSRVRAQRRLCREGLARGQLEHRARSATRHAGRPSAGLGPARIQLAVGAGSARWAFCHALGVGASHLC
jgi:DNA-binding response OmpR family regulator